MAAKLGKILIMGGVFLFALTACMYDLDVTGVVHVNDNVNERFAQSVKWNTENEPRDIVSPETEYAVLIGGDTHVGGTENLQKLIDLTRESSALAMVIAGDVSTGVEEDYLVLDSVLQDAGPAPTCLVAGNHDLYFDGWKSFYQMFGSSTYTMAVHVGDTADLFIFLDSGSGTLGSLQIDWLEDVLEANRWKHRHVIVITHLNFFRNRMTGSTNPLNEELLLLLDLFEKYRIDLLISGHDHDRYIEEFGHTTYVTLDAMVDGVEQASYLELTVNEEGVNFQFIKF